MTDIPITFLSDITRGVKSFLSGIDLATTEVKIVADKSIYEKIFTTVLLIHDFIQERKNNIKERLEVMNSLSNNIIPPVLPYLLDSLECLQSGDLEHIDIVYCDRSKIGLFCELTVSVHKKLAEYEKYVPIVYDDVQIRAHKNGQIFVKDENKHWGLVECEEDRINDYDVDYDIEDFSECTVLPYQNECTNVVMTNEFNKILKYCNFTSKGDIVPIQRSKTGVLLHGEDFLVKEVDPKDNSVVNILQDKYPVHIESKYNLAITLKDRELVMRPYKADIVRTVDYTYLSQSFIDSMKKSAQKLDLLDDLEITHVIDMIYGLLFLLVIPALLTLCCCNIKNSEFVLAWKDKKMYRKGKKKSKSQQNVAENARLLKEIIKK
jgi:hypothetical protein